MSIVSTASVACSEPSDGISESQIIPKSEKKEKIIPHEPWWHTTLQISIPFFLAGIGTVGAGIILGFVEVRKHNNYRNLYRITHTHTNTGVITELYEGHN